MGTENESPEADCQKQFQAAVSVIQNLPKDAGSDTVLLRFSTPAQAPTAPPTKRCCGSTATTSRPPWGPASSPSLGSGTLSDVTNGWKEQVLNGDAEAAPEPRCLPKEPAPPSPESQPPRDQDSEVFCDSVEQLEPELVGEEQRGAVGGEMDTRNSPEPPAERGRLEGPLLGPQELDSWLVGTVRALQESMRDVQGRLQSLESMPVPPEQQMPPPSARPWPLRLSGPTLIFFLLWPFIVQWLFRQFRTQKR
ncbi:acyl-CoA-binding domain-containing protein 4 isoform X7 [Odocoileus virginianus]|uniref:Acyl-CoA-binding domain-containing protein 4 isoform X7 n=1 Tax=Odocoileus virginianus TaxID=9874 RepID=A0ABM4J6P5_ODOVR